jgi:hypothetical protein
MAFFDFFKTLFGLQRRRDVSRLDSHPGHPDQPALDVISETIDLSGGPLKEHHRRRALRDQRLLPKSRALTRAVGLKRRAVMDASEARRLFGATLRTRNRHLRDLLTDRDQLKRLGLPLWEDETSLAAALGISSRELRYFSIHRQREQQPHYVSFALPKRHGGERLIMAPKRRLKAIQRALCTALVNKLPVSEHAHAFRNSRNIKTGALAHVGKRFVLRLDLKDFFPSVTFARVRGLFIACGYSYPVASTLAVLTTEAIRQPIEHDGALFHVPVGPRFCVQGAPTSPALCNAILLRLDRRLAGLARQGGVTYTRYADDLTFSGDVERPAMDKLRAAAAKIIAAEGFVVNEAKTRLMGRGGRQSVTGVVVNQVLGLSRKERRRLRAAAHQLRQPAVTETPEGRRKLLWWRGKLAYLSMLNRTQADALAKRLD